MNESRILVVDDEPDLREILQFNLEQAGYQVDTAESAEAALQVLTPQHALLLLDVMMGGCVMVSSHKIFMTFKA